MRRNPIFIALVTMVLAGALAGSSLTAQAQDATPAADPAANKALVLRFLDEIWNKGTFAVADEILAPDFTWRFGATEIFLVGPEAVKMHYENLRGNIPGVGLTADIAIAEGEYVAVRWSLTSTSQATPSTTTLLCTGNNIYRIAGGLIAELWQESLSCA